MFGVQSQLQQLYTLEPCVVSIRKFEASTAMISLLVPFVPSLLVIVRIPLPLPLPSYLLLTYMMCYC
ncbi:hypothetical protein LINPERPRIM_LOCUS39409 [Linum perenne]